MKKLIAGAAVALLAAAPAFAGEMVIELTRSSGESFTLVLDLGAEGLGVVCLGGGLGAGAGSGAGAGETFAACR